MQNFQLLSDNLGKNTNDTLWGEIDQRRFGDASLLPNEDLHLKFTQVTLEAPTIFQPTPGQEVGLACHKGGMDFFVIYEILPLHVWCCF